MILFVNNCLWQGVLRRVGRPDRLTTTRWSNLFKQNISQRVSIHMFILLLESPCLSVPPFLLRWSLREEISTASYMYEWLAASGSPVEVDFLGRQGRQQGCPYCGRHGFLNYFLVISLWKFLYFPVIFKKNFGEMFCISRWNLLDFCMTFFGFFGDFFVFLGDFFWISWWIFCIYL